MPAQPEFTDPCRCAECDGQCTFKVPRKWYQCRPCTLGFHLAPCEGFVAQRFPTLQPECDRCGYWLADHA